jgi:hypothetical protein
MDGGHGHGGGGDGAHSHGGGGASYGCSPAGLGGFMLFFVGLSLLIGGATFLGHHVYEATHPVHVTEVHGDWTGLFFNLGLAIFLSVVGILLLLAAVVARRGGVLVAGAIALVLAGICGLVLAPHFEAKVIERSPTNPSQLRPPASIRQMVPKRVRLRCDACPNGRIGIAGYDAIDLTVHGMLNTVYHRLCIDGYSDEWTSYNHPLMSSADKTIDEVYHHCYEYSSGSTQSKDIGISAPFPQHPGRWTVTWRLKDPTGAVVLSSNYTVAVQQDLT